MATNTHTIAAGDRAAHAIAASAGDIERVVFPAHPTVVRVVIHDATAAVYYTTDETDPVVDGPQSYVLPPAVCGEDLHMPGGSNEVRLTTAGAATVSVLESPA